MCSRNLQTPPHPGAQRIPKQIDSAFVYQFPYRDLGLQLPEFVPVSLYHQVLCVDLVFKGNHLTV